AAADMAQLRNVMSALVRIGTPLDEVFDHASEMLASASRLVPPTALLVQVDRAAGVVHHLSAGHPPPLLRLPDGTTRPLSDGHRPLLGIPGAFGAPAANEFPVGSVLVAYTDGLI